MHNIYIKHMVFNKLTEVESDTWLSIAKYSKFICILTRMGKYHYPLISLQQTMKKRKENN